MFYARAALLLIAMISAVVFVAPVQALAQRRRWAVRDRIQIGFCRLVCRIIGIEVTTTGVTPQQGPLFVVSNHLSWTDIIALASVHPFVFLAKKEVSTWPVLGFLARLQRTIFVDRNTPKLISSVNAALAQALRDGLDVVVFAEGTSTDGSTPPRFNSAHFDALRDVDAVVAPAAIFYTLDGKVSDVGWYGSMTFLPHLGALLNLRKLRCHIAFGEEIHASGKDRKTLASQTQSAVRALLEGSMQDFGGNKNYGSA